MINRVHQIAVGKPVPAIIVSADGALAAGTNDEVVQLSETDTNWISIWSSILIRTCNSHG